MRADPEQAALRSAALAGKLRRSPDVNLVTGLAGRPVLGQAKTRAAKHRRKGLVHLSRRRRHVVRRRLGGFVASVVTLCTTALWQTLHSLPLALLIAVFCSVVGFVLGRALRRRERGRPGRSLAWFSSFSARGLTVLAARLAGGKRPGLREEWRAHLAGESGHDPVTWRKVKEALGFVASALQFRLADAVAAAWAPADAILKSRKLSNLLVFGPTAIATHLILRHEGALGVVTSAESVSAIGGGLYMLVRVGRWWRNVKPPEPKARRVRSD